MNHIVEQKLDQFFFHYPPIHFRAGEVIIRAGDDEYGIFYLKNGLVKQTYISEIGEEMTIHIFKPISFFPIMLALSQKTNMYTFEAVTAIKLWKAPKEATIALLKEEPEVSFDLASRLSLGITGLTQKMENILFSKAGGKVASLLLYLANKFGTRQSDGTLQITLPLTHSDIGSWTGLQRETVSRQIELLQDKGILHREKDHLVISDIGKLQQIAQE